MNEHPVHLLVSDDLRRSRGTVFFRAWFALPFFLWLALWSIAALIVVPINWLATLARGRSPEALHRFLARFVRFATHAYAYVKLGGRAASQLQRTVPVCRRREDRARRAAESLERGLSRHPGSPRGPHRGRAHRLRAVPGGREQRPCRRLGCPRHLCLAGLVRHPRAGRTSARPARRGCIRAAYGAQFWAYLAAADRPLPEQRSADRAAARAHSRGSDPVGDREMGTGSG